MEKCLVMPDSFKGTVSAIEFCDIAKEAIKEKFPFCEVVCFPIADGGEGTADCFLQLEGYEKKYVTVSDAYMSPCQVYYAQKGEVAVVELAKCAGLPQFENRKNPCLTTTFGVGEMIAKAIESGAKKIILGLGGSCTNDGGTGMAFALGAKFYDKDKKEIFPKGDNLNEISYIDLQETKEKLKGISVVAMCDINNPLFGENGAAYVFAPQKGADKNMVAKLDNNLRSLSFTVEKITGENFSETAGVGAAGGAGFGVLAFLGGSLSAGIDIVLDTINFEKEAENAKIIFTGEGRLDKQSLGGKAVIGIARRAKLLNKPVIAVVGSAEDEFEKSYQEGVSCVFTTNLKAIDFKESKKDAKKNLKYTFQNIVRLIEVCESFKP